MTTIKVLTDSSCDLPPDYFREYGIGVVPISIRFGDRVYLEGVDLDRNAFYQKVNELGVLPKTSQPSVGEFSAAYRACAAQGYDTLLSVHVASTLSGTTNSATLAAQEVAGEVKVIPYDSLSGSAAMGFMCVEAVRMARAGKSVSEIVTRLNEAWPVGIKWVGEYVRATINTAEQRLTVWYQPDADSEWRLLKTRQFRISETAHDLLPAFRRNRTRCRECWPD